MPQDKLNALIYHDPKKSAPDFKTLPEPELQTSSATAKRSR